MSSTVILEGLGASITGNGITARPVITLSLPERALEAIPTDTLSSVDVKTSKPGGLMDPGQVTVEFEYDPATTSLLTKTIGEYVLTLPSSGGTLTFSGWVQAEGGEEFSVGTRLTTKITIQVTSKYVFAAAATGGT
jgi:hypothetical protein